MFRIRRDGMMWTPKPFVLTTNFRRQIVLST